jgi:hypothetical protein
VEDENHNRIAGAIVVFTLPPEGPGGSFPGGVTTLSTVTDSGGRAIARGLRPNNLAGRFEIRVNASYEGKTGHLIMFQTNVGAAAPAHVARWIVIAAVAGGVAAKMPPAVVSNARGPKRATKSAPAPEHTFAGWDVGEAKTPEAKAAVLVGIPCSIVDQREQLAQPQHVIIFGETTKTARLSHYAYSHAGLQTGDAPRFLRTIWELSTEPPGWAYCAEAPDYGKAIGGLSRLCRWNHSDDPFNLGIGVLRGREAWGQIGVTVGLMRDLPTSLYYGTLFNDNAAVIVPHRQEDLPGIFAYLQSDDFNARVREINQKVAVKTQYLTMIEYDRAHWHNVAAEQYPNGLGPRGTGKSHIYQQISPYSHLISGGKATVAKMFVNMASASADWSVSTTWSASMKCPEFPSIRKTA